MRRVLQDFDANLERRVEWFWQVPASKTRGLASDFKACTHSHLCTNQVTIKVKKLYQLRTNGRYTLLSTLIFLANYYCNQFIYFIERYGTIAVIYIHK